MIIMRAVSLAAVSFGLLALVVGSIDGNPAVAVSGGFCFLVNGLWLLTCGRT